MGALGTYCFDGLNFAQATTLYTNSTLSVLAADGYYSQGGIVRQQLSGVLLNAQACGTCEVACGNGISVSISANGFFDVNFDVASTTGAIVLYFYMGSSIADGVLANYNSTNYNRLTAKGNDGTTLVDGSGTAVDYSGINNQGTGDPTYVGSDSANIIIPYTNTSVTPGVCVVGDAPENYSYTGGSYVAQGTLYPLTVTNAMCGRALFGSPVFTMVVPKSTASPTTMNLKVSAPYCGTFFAYEIDCPAALPGFSSSIPQNDAVCNTAQGQTYYFVRNASGTSTPFTVDVNTIPEVGNFVFTDANGSTYLNDSGTIKYIINGTTALGIRNGVVISSVACTSAPLGHLMSDSISTSSGACSLPGTPTTTVYSSSFTVGGFVYLNSALSTIFVGDSGWYHISDFHSVYQINSFGEILDLLDCFALLYTIDQCDTALVYTVENDFTFSLNDVVQFQVGTPGSGAIYCGTVTNLNSSGTANATLYSAQTYTCGDAVHCAT